MSRRAIPLPATLTGVEQERCITLDAALFYLVSGALLAMLDAEFEQTGTLTPEQAREMLSDAFEEFQNA
jgi:hypothetical protein